MPNNEYIKEIERNIDDEDTSCGVQIRHPFSPSDIKLSTNPMNLGDLIDMIQEGWINFGTDYQRAENLWTEEQQCRLIESVLLGLRLPAFYFEEVFRRRWNIIDGLQRCCAIRNFCVDNAFPLAHLEFLDKELKGKFFKDFDFATKRDIRMLPITVNVLEKGTPDEVKYILFRRLNTGGINLNAQEIRNAVFIGRTIDLIAEMAKDKAFLEATNNSIPTLRKTDMDFVSRFIAFYLQDYTEYRPDLESFINSAMMKIKSGAVNMDKMKDDFHKSMLWCHKIFGDNAFRKTPATKRKSRINKALFEVISVLFSRLSPNDLEIIHRCKDNFLGEFYAKLRNDKNYSNSFSGGTGNKESVSKRFNDTIDLINQYTEH